MSAYTTEQLREGTRVGFGKAWWGEGHFAGAVPIDEARELLTVDVAEGTVRVELEDPTPIIEMIRTASTLDDARRYADVLLGMREDQPDGNRFKGVVDRTNGYVFQIASRRWSNDGHQYEQMLEHASALLDVSDGDLIVGSVIALDHRQKAMLQIRPNDGITIGGDKMLPWLALYSSLDSSWASTIKGCTTRAVCDNTAAMVAGERTVGYSRKHTGSSAFELADCRRVLDVFWESAAAEVAEIEQLMSAAVTDEQYWQVADIVLPVNGSAKATGRTRRTNVRDAVWQLYADDVRVAPHRDTAWGVVQAWSTYSIHGVTPKGKSRVERQTFNLLSGVQEAADMRVRLALQSVVGV